MSVARFIADQRTMYRVPHAFTCRTLQVSESWFYKWLDRPPTPRQDRRGEVDTAVLRLAARRQRAARSAAVVK